MFLEAGKMKIKSLIQIEICFYTFDIQLIILNNLN